MTESGYRRLSASWVAILLLLCLAHGLSTVSGITYPPDVDSLRDIGFAQGILNGDVFGDPAYAGETRWYPPLVPAFVAAAGRLFGIADLPNFWVQAGPWINLLVPVTFFLAAQRLLGSTVAAAAALTAFVLFDGTVGGPWVTGGYTPWPFIPNISQSLFFLTLWLIISCQGSRRWLDAACVGGAIGVTFLAHPVPAIILTFVATAVAFGTCGLKLRTIRWLAVVAVVQLAVMSPYLGPIALHYRGGIVHSKPGLWLDPLMTLDPGSIALTALLNAPGVLALFGAAYLYRRGIRLERAAAIALAAWIIPCIAIPGRHYACGPEATAAACRIFVVPVHHYHLYLQTAWAMLIGFVCAQLFPERGSPSRNRIAAVVVLAVLSIGGWSFLNRKYDAATRDGAMAQADGGALIDLDAYRWILANVGTNDTLATPLAADWGDPAAFAAYAAGRKLVALPLLHSNPYVVWEPRDARREQILNAATGNAPPAALCGYPGGTLRLLLPIGTPVDETRVESIYSTKRYTFYRVRSGIC